MLVSKSSLSESGKLPKLSSGVSRNLTDLDKRISKFVTATERGPPPVEVEAEKKVELKSEEVDEKENPNFKRLRLA